MAQPHPTTPEHREMILAELAKIWAKYPNLRLGQMVANACADPFYTHDTALLERIVRAHET